MVEKTQNTPEICVGLTTEVANNLLSQPMFTPSKVGGYPANISPLPLIAKVCNICKTNLTFIAQLYANTDDLIDFHRTIFIFACLSEKCINTVNCVRAFREIIHDKNPFTHICTDEEYDDVCDLSDYQLSTTGKWAPILEKVIEPQMKVSKDGCVLEEYLLDTVVEPTEVSKIYRKQSQRIAYKIQDDELFEELEQSFTELHFGRANREFEQMAQNLFDQVKQAPIEEDDSEDDDEDEADEKTQPLVKTDMSEEYKLFEVVSSAFPKQVLRYITPNSRSMMEPLWLSDKHKLLASNVPKCEWCGSKRQLEIQITPQLFDYMTPLHYVDWDSICVYTCTNLGKCLPNFVQNEFFVQEFAYIQFSSDFEKVKYGTPEQVQKLRSQVMEQEVYVETEEEKKDEEEKARKKAEKNKKQREKKKQKMKEAKETSAQIQQQINTETADLIANLKL